MEVQRIVLAHDVTFLRSTLRRLIDKTEHLQVVAEVNRLSEVPKALETTRATWLLLTLPEDGELPVSILDAMEHFPHLRVLAVAKDGSQLRVEWLERRDRETSHLSVQDFMDIFDANTPH
jgi:DNA-binding NarL/FixJ family response regulator